MPVQVLDYSLSNFKVPGLAQYAPPFGTKKADGSGLTTLEITRNEMMPFLKQRPVSGVPAIAGADPPMGVIGEDSIASPIEFDANFAVAEGVQLQLADPAYEGQFVRVTAAFETGNPASVIPGATGSPQLAALNGGETMLLFAVNGKWTRFTGGDAAVPVTAGNAPFLAACDKRKLAVKAGTKINLAAGGCARTFLARQDTELSI